MYTMRGQFIAYYRVSTQQQGRSGLGLEAQREAVHSFLNGGDWELIEEFTEIESGKRATRPQLLEALSQCKKRKATLVIAKLDRLSRNARFLLGIVESGVDVIFCDMPDLPTGAVGKFMLTQLAAVAELEAGLTSERTKAALKAAKERGVELGKNGHELAALNKGTAITYALCIEPLLKEISDLSLRKQVEELNDRKIPTPKGGRWHLQSLQRIKKRLITA